jgi:hypothetical protein
VEVSNRRGKVTSAPISVQVCAPNLRIYRDCGIKLTFQARKCIRYTIECRNALSHEGAWNVFATIKDKNRTVTLTDHNSTAHPLCVFRLKAEATGRCSGGHTCDDDDDNDNDHDHDHHDDDDDDDHDHDDKDDDHHGDDDDDD